MISKQWRTILLLLLWLFNSVTCRSCHYNNLHALPDWSRVRSPSYPQQFPAQTQCWWKITAPPQFRVQLELTDFSLVAPNRGNKCVWQWLNIIEGVHDDTTGGQPPMLTLCGTNKPRLVISSGNTLRLNLHSNAAAASSPYRGFSARYKYTSEDAFLPDNSNELPDNLTPGGSSNSGPSPPMSGPSIGDAINPFIKPRPLPPNPNAVLTLQNRRTEAKNQARNNGLLDSNNEINNGPPMYGEGRRPMRRPTPYRPIPTLSNNIIRQEELPPPRTSKPLPHEIRILLAVLGTVGAIILILYFIKRFAYDKAHKKSSGRIMHAYAHFRKFKKKKGRDAAENGESKVNTITASVASANGTIHSRDSGHVSLNGNEVLKGAVSSIPDTRDDSYRGTKSGKSIANPVTPEPAEHRQSSAQHRKNDNKFEATDRRPQDCNPPSRAEGDGTSASDASYDEEYRSHRHRRRRHRDHEPSSRHPRHERQSDYGNNISKMPVRENLSSRAPTTQSRAVRSERKQDSHHEHRRSRGNTHGRSRRRSPSIDSPNRASRSTWRERAYS